MYNLGLINDFKADQERNNLKNILKKSLTRYTLTLGTIITLSIFMLALFYLFATIAVLASAGAILFRNTLYNVLSLIVVFFNIAGILLLTGAEFLALIFLIVYVGAVAVLFLFVVMMLDGTKKNVNEKPNTKGHFLASGLTALVFAFEMITVARTWATKPRTLVNIAATEISNTEALGMLIYTHYFYVFQIAGLILLVAIIGAIVLTMNKKNTTHKKQIVSLQLQRSKDNSLIIKRVNFKEGVKEEDLEQNQIYHRAKNISYPNLNNNHDKEVSDDCY